ncbi:MAG: hypothetical protein J6I68_04685 [Butyrivibrio sp.]|uniref:hypothetical protein n=1 Tax=Butyrivibrio sp. TaxID=28121 RepID=UPI001B505CA3|nr:hypothetical protein [Butyrivibrio sp.]MBP3782525.1 hypothetical protein [Butyrivibrio sp.]
MKKQILVMMAAAMLLGGCAGKAEADDATIFEKTGEETQDSTGAENAGAEDAEMQTADAGNAAAESADAGAADSDDYTDTIKSEIDDIAGSAADLSDELVKVNGLYDKYDEMRMNAQDQTSINLLSQWGTVVWKDETISLLDRISQSNSTQNKEIHDEYEKWEKYVPTMVERMSKTYEDGSMYPMIYSYNEAMRYKQMAYSLASSLADIKGDGTFTFPDSTPYGYYGDYAGDSYLIITEGMESGSYDIVIHIDDSKELRGTGVDYESPESTEVIMFTSDDETVKGMIDFFAIEASFYVTETDGSVVDPEGSYTFTFKY